MRAHLKTISVPLIAMQCALSLYLVAWQAQTVCLASETMNKAATLYKEGKYTESLEFIEIELAANPNSASAHYLFGNVLLHRNAVPDALREYRKAVALDPKGTFGRYSMQEIARLTGGSLPSPAGTGQGPRPAGPDPSAALSPPQSRAAVTPPQQVPEDPELAARRRAVVTTSQQTREQSLNTTDEFQARINELKREADGKIAALNEEMNSLIAANGTARYVRGIINYDPAPQNEIIRADFKDRIMSIQADADRRIEELQRLHDQKQQLIEQTGLSVDRALAAPTRPGDIKVVPQGTDLHVRNFETADQPSGSVVPLIAEPGKLSLDSKKSKKEKKQPAKNAGAPGQ